MTIIIGILMVMALIIIAASPFTSVNKSAVSMFAGAVGWVLYLCFGTDFVMAHHSAEYISFLSGTEADSVAVKEYIASNIFIKYVGRGAEIILFLIATMKIVEILENNGCFDFLPQWIKTRHSKRLLWSVATLTLLVSANLDNLTSTIMILVLMHKTISNRRHRAVFGAVIVLSANIGGALTVIGDPNGLLLWNMGAVTPSHYSAWMILPCLVAWAVPTALMSRMLPERLDLESYTLPYRGDDTNLQLWQRILMFFFSIAGLWFIPIFHNITRLSPFVGALCVLSLLWIVNEIFNRKLIDSGQITHQRPTHLLQDSLIQTMLYVMGIMLIMGILIETGAGHFVGRQAMLLLGDVWTIAIAPFIAGMVSLVLDPFASAATFFSLYDIQGTEYLMQNGEYWISIAYATAVGSTILGIGSLSGLAMFKMRSATIGWYVKYASPKIFLGALLGLLVLIAEAVVF